MLNRTNRTLSAHRNRLNLGLGTRSLAPVARFNDGTSTLHTRPVYPVVMRAGVAGVPVEPITVGPIGIPSIPGSPSVSPWLIASCAILSRVDSSTDGIPFPDAKRVAAFDPFCHREAEPTQRPTRRLSLPGSGSGSGQADRKPLVLDYAGKRWQQGQPAGLAGRYPYQQATPGPVAAAAQAAATGG